MKRSGCFRIRSCAPKPDFENPISQFCSLPVGRQVLLHPRHQFFSHESLILDIRVHGIIRVPGVDPECRLDDRQVVLVLRIERAHGFQPVPEAVTQPCFNREHEKEIVRHPGGGVCGSQDPQACGPGPLLAEVT